MGIVRIVLSTFFSVALTAGAIDAASAQADRRVALVVGNSNYHHVARLANPANDARLMAETLKGLGFRLVGDAAQLDLDETAFRRAVRDFGDALTGASVALFYYAGHGVQVRGGNYLVPIGANPVKEADVDFQMLDTNLVLRQMESAGARLNLVILDACRNNPFGGRGLRSTDSGLAQMRAPEGTLISFATQPGNVALDGTDANSPYTRALARAIRKPGLDIFRTFNEVGLEVTAATRGAQQPWVSLSPIKGDFYFAGAPSEPAAQPRPDPAAQAWTVIQNTTSIAVLEEFVRQFGSTPFGSMARARIDELKSSQIAAIPPQQPPQPSSGADRVLSDNFVGAAGDCEYLCTRDNRCRSFRYDASSKKCQLLDGLGGNRPSVSAPVSIPHVSPPTASLPAPGARGYDHTYVGSSADCQFVCSRDSRCRSHVYDPTSRKCELLDRAGPAPSPPVSVSASPPRPSTPTAPAAKLTRDHTFVSNALDCETVCKQNRGCRNFSFQAETKKCFYESFR